MKSSVLENGVQVLSEQIPNVRSVALGIWVRHGAAHDPEQHLGASHLLEHLVFKGTSARTGRELVLALEGVGGSIDAYTGREHTGYQAKVMDAHAELAVDVLADLVMAPLLRQEDLELERQVVLEEIAQVDDTPDDLVFEKQGEFLWNGHPYGRPILGTRATVDAISAEGLRCLHRTRYCGTNLVVAGAGRIDHEALVGWTEGRLGSLEAGEAVPALPDPSPLVGRQTFVPHDGVQSHIVIGSPTPGHSDARRHALVLLAAAFGGGMSSRLFQRLREDLALGYSVYSYQSFNRDAGVTGMYLGTRPGWEGRALEAIRSEYAALAEHGLPEDELARTKQQVTGQLMLSLESTSSRLYRVAGPALYGESFRSVDDVLKDINAIDAEQVRGVAAEFFAPWVQTALVLGPEGQGGGIEGPMAEAWPELRN